jgi:hypothetical protein
VKSSSSSARPSRHLKNRTALFDEQTFEDLRRLCVVVTENVGPVPETSEGVGAPEKIVASVRVHQRDPGCRHRNRSIRGPKLIEPAHDTHFARALAHEDRRTEKRFWKNPDRPLNIVFRPDIDVSARPRDFWLIDFPRKLSEMQHSGVRVSLAQPGAIGRVLHQGMLEQIGRVRRHALAEQQTGLLGTSQKKAEQEQQYYPQFSEKMREEADAMAAQFAIFYCLENSIRELISNRLEEIHGEDWWELAVPPNVKENATKNRSKEVASGVTLSVCADD